MNALLLSAGIGERLRPFTFYFPKCLLPVPQETLLKYWATTLLDSGIDKIYVNTFWLQEKIKEYVETLDFNLSKHIVLYREKELEPVGKAISNLGGKLGRKFLVINSDTFIGREEISFFVREARVSQQFPLCLGVSWQESVIGKSQISLDEDDIIVEFVEKPQKDSAGFSYAGILLADNSLIYQVREMEHKELTNDIIPAFIGRTTTINVGRVIDIGGSIEGYFKAYNDLLKEI